MRIIYFSDPIDKRKVDIEYEFEYKIAKKIGFDIGLINYEDLVSKDNADNRIKDNLKNLEEAVFRGWMLRPLIYEKMYKMLLKKNIKLINSPKEYKNCHYTPQYYNFIKSSTPKTIWIEEDKISEDLNFIVNEIKVFGNAPVILKDFVKSRKFEWEEACFIPNALDEKKVKGVIRRFLELQGDKLNGGLVFRKFVDLEFLTKHSKSNLPLSKEFRLFFYKKELIQVIHYWEEGDYGDLEPDLNEFTNIAQSVESNFFTMDIAKEVNGNWIILELGDGQVSWLPKTVNVFDFYNNILKL
jgi:hypothetical protein